MTDEPDKNIDEALTDGALIAVQSLTDVALNGTLPHRINAANSLLDRKGYTAKQTTAPGPTVQINLGSALETLRTVKEALSENKTDTLQLVKPTDDHAAVHVKGNDTDADGV